MPAVDRTLSDLLRGHLQAWDKGNRGTRGRILVKFLEHFDRCTEPELEREFANGASLFLARVGAWLRLNADSQSDLVLPLRVLSVFVGASSGKRFLREVIEVVGIHTVVELLTSKLVDEDSKEWAAVIITQISSAGRPYREAVCKHGGPEAVRLWLRSSGEQGQDTAQSGAAANTIGNDAAAAGRGNLNQIGDKAARCLLSLARNNPYYSNQIREALMAMLTGGHSTSQMTASRVIRLILQPDPADGSVPWQPDAQLVQSSRDLLLSAEVNVQHEGSEMIRSMILHSSAWVDVSLVLRDWLRPMRIEPPMDETGVRQAFESTPTEWLLQAATAKLILSMVASLEDDDFMVVFTKQGGAIALLTAMANVHHDSSRLLAAQAFNGLLETVPAFENEVVAVMGQPWIRRWRTDSQALLQVFDYNALNECLELTGMNEWQYLDETAVTEKHDTTGTSGEDGVAEALSRDSEDAGATGDDSHHENAMEEEQVAANGKDVDSGSSSSETKPKDVVPDEKEA